MLSAKYSASAKVNISQFHFAISRTSFCRTTASLTTEIANIPFSLSSNELFYPLFYLATVFSALQSTKETNDWDDVRRRMTWIKFNSDYKLLP